MYNMSQIAVAHDADISTVYSNSMYYNMCKPFTKLNSFMQENMFPLSLKLCTLCNV